MSGRAVVLACAPAFVCLAAAALTGCGRPAISAPYYPVYSQPARPAYTEPAPPPPVPAEATPDQRERNARRELYVMMQASLTVSSQLDRARAQKDVVKTTCLNDKLAQIDVAVDSAMQRHAALRAAAKDNDAATARHEESVLKVLRQRVDQLNAESNQCVGELAFASETVVTASARTTSDVMRSVPGVARHSIGSGSGSGGGSGSTSGVSYGAPARPAPPPPPPPMTLPPAPPPASGVQERARTAETAPHDASMLVYSASLAVTVPHVERALDAIESMAREDGGYLSSRGDREITIRVPRERFAASMARIEKMGDVLRRVVTALDVTDEYVDLELRLKNARAMRDRLEELLKQAAVKEAVQIAKELGRLQMEIESMEGKMMLLRERIAYSTITVALRGKDETPVQTRTMLPFPWLDVVGLPGLLDLR